MSENSIPITPKEKMLVKILVRLYTKEKLENEFDETIKYGESNSNLVNGASKLIGIETWNTSNRFGSQYLNYAIKNYEDIKNEIYPDEIERVQEVLLYADEIESVVHYDTKRVRVYLLPSYIDEASKYIYEKFYEYDPDTIETNYGDSDFISFEPLPEDTYVSKVNNNVLN
jgi:hypothetical protein